MRLTGAQVIVQTLAECGVDTVFGYPGGYIIDVYDSLYKSRRIRHVLTAHEQGAAHAADGYARRSGRVGVVLATSGPGATNLVTGLANAYLDSVPLVAVTCGVPPAVFGKDNFQEVDVFGVTMPVTKHNFIVKTPDVLADTLRRAFALALEGRRGPVAVDIHLDLKEKIRFTPAVKGGEATENTGCDDGLIAAAARFCDGCQRPLLYVGGGVAAAGSAAVDALAALSQKLDAPVCVSSRGLGCFHPDSPRYLGLLGMHGTRAALRAARECDLLIAVGARFSDRTVGPRERFAPGAKVIHIDIDPAEIDKIRRADVGIAGDAAAILPALCAAVLPRQHTDRIAGLRAGSAARLPDLPTPGQGFCNPQRLIEAAQAARPDAAVVTDVGQHQIWVWQYGKFTRPGQLVTSCGLGAMGFGMGAAVGTRVADPETPVLLVTGDGSFHMDLAELATMVTCRLPIVIAVFDNGTLGMVRQWQKAFFNGRYSQTETARRTDFVRLAKAFGAGGHEVAPGGFDALTAQFDAAFTEAQRRRRPVVLHCRIDPETPALPEDFNGYKTQRS